MWETLRKEEVLKVLNTSKKEGLSNEEVIIRRKKYGENKLKETSKESLITKFIKQFNDFMFVILICNL